MKNKEIARFFHEMAKLQEMQGETFKPRAYRRAARTIESWTEDLTDIFQRRGKDGLKEIPGIGINIANKIEEILQTGRLQALEKLQAEIPSFLVELGRIPGVGPKTAIILYDTLKVDTINELERVIKKGGLKGLKGIGPKTIKNILHGIQIYRQGMERILLWDALKTGYELIMKLEQSGLIQKICLAGSLRRKKETIGDIDILAVSKAPPKQLMEFFVALDKVQRVLAKGKTKSSIILENGIQTDLRVVEQESYGAALQYFTGSKDHNVKVRHLAIEKSMKLNEYGLFKKKTDEKIAGASEREIYDLLGLQYIEPECREDQGEIEAALQGNLPNLLQLKDVRGELHAHTKWSDGAFSVREMAEAAKAKGYEYLVLADHSQSLKIAHGLTPDQLRERGQEIEKVNDELNGTLHILEGTEVDIFPDGSLDYPASILEDLDIVIGGVHTRLRMTAEEMTQRLVNAMQTGLLDVLAHPTTRMIGKRESAPMYYDRVFEVAAETKTVLEIDSHPDRMDLDSTKARQAKDYGVMLGLSTDAHHINHLDFMEIGISIARRAWLEPKNVLNCLSFHELRKMR
ncbi:MAG: DNA polymerase/3'-5' exonuclease PolX [Candidatus Heimdallarchaeota archaeon]